MKQADLKETIGIVANVGVVVGIFFLVFETHQNTNALYAQSRQSTLTAAQAELFEMLDRPDLAFAVLQDGPLSELEQFQLSAWLNALMRAREFSWLQYQDGIMDEAQWSTERTIIHWVLSAPRTREWWERTSPYNFGESFRAFVDREIADQPVSEEIWRTDMNWASQ